MSALLKAWKQAVAVPGKSRTSCWRRPEREWRTFPGGSYGAQASATRFSAIYFRQSAASVKTSSERNCILSGTETHADDPDQSVRPTLNCWRSPWVVDSAMAAEERSSSRDFLYPGLLYPGIRWIQNLQFHDAFAIRGMSSRAQSRCLPFL